MAKISDLPVNTSVVGEFKLLITAPDGKSYAITIAEMMADTGATGVSSDADNALSAGTDGKPYLAESDLGSGGGGGGISLNDVRAIIGSEIQAWSAVLDATTASFTTDDETKLDGLPDNSTLTASLAAKAPLAGPTFTGEVTVPDQDASADGDLAVNSRFVKAVVGALPAADVIGAIEAEIDTANAILTTGADKTLGSIPLSTADPAPYNAVLTSPAAGDGSTSVWTLHTAYEALLRGLREATEVVQTATVVSNVITLDTSTYSRFAVTANLAANTSVHADSWDGLTDCARTAELRVQCGGTGYTMSFPTGTVVYNDPGEALGASQIHRFLLGKDGTTKTAYYVGAGVAAS